MDDAAFGNNAVSGVSSPKGAGALVQACEIES